MNIVDPHIDLSKQRQIKELSKVALRSLEGQDGLTVIHALCLALASASSTVGVTHIEDITEELTAMFRSIEASKPSVVNPKVTVVGPEQFRRIAASFGVKF